MKPSELKPVDIAFFARKITESSEFEGLSDLEKMECADALEASTAAACAYTGLDMRGMDNYPDITYAIKVMATEMPGNHQDPGADRRKPSWRRGIYVSSLRQKDGQCLFGCGGCAYVFRD